MSETRSKIGEAVTWSALVVYLAAWVLVPMAVAWPSGWLIGLVVGLAYVGMHCFEIAVRGHGYLSADSTAVPVAIAMTVALMLLLEVSGHWDDNTGKAFVALAGSYVLGHLAALGYSVAVGVSLEKLMATRIANEETTGGINNDPPAVTRPRTRRATDGVRSDHSP